MALFSARKSMDVGAIFKKMDNHIAKRCKYCIAFELQDNVPIASFVSHLEEKHPDMIDGKELDDFRRITQR